MKESIVQKKSFEFSLKIISLYKKLQQEREFVISNQILRSGTSIVKTSQSNLTKN